MIGKGTGGDLARVIQFRKGAAPPLSEYYQYTNSNIIAKYIEQVH